MTPDQIKAAANSAKAQLSAAQAQADVARFEGDLLKTLDARWLARAVRGPARQLHRAGRLDVIDAHFGYPEGVACVQVARDGAATGGRGQTRG